MSSFSDPTLDTFVQASEVWIPEGDRLVHGGGDYGDLVDFAAVSGKESFGHGEGLPGKAWAEARPVVLKGFEGSYFKRTEAARAAGLTCAVAVPVFDGATLKAVLVVLCGDDARRTGAIEAWRQDDRLLRLDDGYYGAARHFEWISRHTQFPPGQGLPGGVWASKMPMMMRDLGAGYRFIRAEAAGEAGLTTGLGMPVPTPTDTAWVLTLLSARGTPIARRFELWDARAATVGASGEAVLVDGLCEREGPLWVDETGTPARVRCGEGPVGEALATGLPIVGAGRTDLPAGWRTQVALPIHLDGELAHVVAWYC